MNKRKEYGTSRGFTIVELLIVIVVIAILAAITIISFNGVQSRATASKRSSDFTILKKSIDLARQSQQKTLTGITGAGWSAGPCVSSSAGNNTGQVEPRELPKTHACWTSYYNVIDTVAAASGTDLSGIRNGDSRGNPYLIDENEGEAGTSCVQDGFNYFVGNGVARSYLGVMPLSGFSGCSV